VRWVVVAVALLAGGYALHRSLLWMERRRWIYYRNRPPGAGASALQEVSAIWEPEKHHYTEERSSAAARGDEAESDDEPYDDGPCGVRTDT
jgi:hypothetical protein